MSKFSIREYRPTILAAYFNFWEVLDKLPNSDGKSLLKEKLMDLRLNIAGYLDKEIEKEDEGR